MLEDRALQALQPRRRLDPELLDQVASGLCVRREGVRLAPVAVEREHQLIAKGLARGVGVRERADLAHDGLVTTEGELRLEPGLERAEADILEALRLGGGEGVVLEPFERPPPPEVEPRPDFGDRRLELPGTERPLAGLDEVLETVHVNRLAIHGEQVPAAAARDLATALAGGERLAQPRNVHLQVAARRCALPRPHGIHERRPRDDAVRVQDEQRKHRSALAGQRHHPPLVEHLRRAQQPVLRVAIHTRLPTLPRVMRAL